MTKASQKMPSVGERYSLDYVIGAGSLGKVWQANHRGTGRLVAIKTFSGLEQFLQPERRADALAQLGKAVRIQATIDSQFIARVLDQDTSCRPPYVVYELATGGCLRQLIEERGQLEPQFALTIFTQIVHGLNSAHSIGVIHQDLKPENVLFDHAGNVKLTDFGASSVVDKSQSLRRGVYVAYGSLGYMAPELLKKDARRTKESDLYALGIILYEMLVGRLPGRRSPMPSAVVEGLPAIVDELFDELTQDDLAERSRGLDDVLKRLSEAEGLPVAIANSSAQVFTRPPIALPGLAQLDTSLSGATAGDDESLAAPPFAASDFEPDSNANAHASEPVGGREDEVAVGEAVADAKASDAQVGEQTKEGHSSLLSRIITEANDSDRSEQSAPDEPEEPSQAGSINVTDFEFSQSSMSDVLGVDEAPSNTADATGLVEIPAVDEPVVSGVRIPTGAQASPSEIPTVVPNVTPRRPRSGHAPGLTGQQAIVTSEQENARGAAGGPQPSGAELAVDVFDSSISDSTSGMDTLAPVEKPKSRGFDFPMADDSEASMASEEKGPTTQVIEDRRAPSVVVDESLYDDETERRDTQIKKIGGRTQTD